MADVIEKSVLSVIEKYIQRSDKIQPLDVPLSGSTRFSNEIGLDSLERVSLVAELERHFGIELIEDEEFSIDTIDELVAMVRGALFANATENSG